MCLKPIKILNLMGYYKELDMDLVSMIVGGCVGAFVTSIIWLVAMTIWLEHRK